MRKSILLVTFIGLIIFGLLTMYSFKNITGFAVYNTQTISTEQLGNLKSQAKVECLQNSQCAQNFECINNKCVDNKNINLCQDMKLYSPGTRLFVGQRINLIKEVVTYSQLPYLLPHGELVEIINNNLSEYFYTQIILIGDNILEKNGDDYFIKINDEPIYTYRLTFSKAVDFSNQNIQGQILRILGKEYIIGDDSDNSKIYLVSTDKNKKFKLENKENVKEGFFPNSVEGASVNLVKNNEGDIIAIEILFNELNKKDIKSSEKFVEPAFNSIELLFNGVEDEIFADVRIGGNC